MAAATRDCGRTGCSGRVEDGYCTECGKAPRPEPPATAVGTSPAGPVSALLDVPSGGKAGTLRGGSSGGATEPAADHGGSGSGRRAGRGRMWSDLVWLTTVPYQVPQVMADPEVPERARRCGACEAPVGRSREGRPARPDGFCTECGTPYSFSPTLVPGDLVAGQYEVSGCLTRGGLGWIYLARDWNLDGLPVVLKGLLNTGDVDAQDAAITERRFMIEINHPGIVRILNFVRHPDPRTGAMMGYIVMEYVGGLSLDRVAAVGEAGGILPVEQAIAYALEALAILGDLHEEGILFCDFKDTNVMQVGDQLKLIDLGGARRIDQGDDAVIWGTKGYEAPEISTMGPSVSSDLYTVARTLAKLTFDSDVFRKPRAFSTVYRDYLPGPDQVPLLAGAESFHRFLQRATHPDRDLRFPSAAAMADQLRGVLREVLAARDGVPRLGPSVMFTPERRIIGDAAGLETAGLGDDEAPGALSRTGRLAPAAAAALPVPQVDLADPGAPFLAALSVTEPGQLLAELDAFPVKSVEVQLRRVRAHIETGDLDGAFEGLAAVDRESPWDWRGGWYRGLVTLAAGRQAEARNLFDRSYDLLPGEAATKLALAFSSECCGELVAAGRLYQVVWRADRSYVNAAFGLARVRLAQDDRVGAVAVLQSVPRTSSHHVTARVAAIRARVRGRDGAELTVADLIDAAADLADLSAELAEEHRERLTADILEAALAWIAVGRPGPAGSGFTPTLLDQPFTEYALRAALERSYRALARSTRDLRTRVTMVERANRIRPWRWF